MLSRAQNFFNKIISFATERLYAIAEHPKTMMLLGRTDLLLRPSDIEQTLKKIAQEATNGIGMIRIGPPKIGRHLVYVIAKSPEQANQQIKQVMELKDESARSHYGFFHFVTQSSFVLGMNNEEGVALRRKMMPYFNASAFHNETTENVKSIWVSLYQAHANNNMFILKNHIRDIFSKIFLGSPLTDKMHQILNDIDDNFADFLLIPQIAFHIMPETRKMKQSFDNQIKRLLREIIRGLQNDSVIGKNYLTDTLREKGQFTHFSELSTAEIDRLVQDEEVRACVTLLLGVNNIAKVAINALSNIFNSENNENKKQLNKLRQELSHVESQTMDLRSLRNKNMFPYLHAVYLESLRLFSPTDFIVRYSSEEIMLGETSIPSNATIIVNLTSAMHEAYGYDFKPEQYLTPEGKLNETAKLHQGFLAPFGMGKRRCPATEITEVVFKDLIVSATQYLLNFNSRVINFRDLSIPFSACSKRSFQYDLQNDYYTLLFSNSYTGNMTILINFDTDVTTNECKKQLLLKEYLDVFLNRAMINQVVRLDIANFEHHAHVLRGIYYRNREQGYYHQRYEYSEEERIAVNASSEIIHTRQVLMHVNISNKQDLHELAYYLYALGEDIRGKKETRFERKGHLLTQYMAAEAKDEKLVDELHAKMKANSRGLLFTTSYTYLRNVELVPASDQRQDINQAKEIDLTPKAFTSLFVQESKPAEETVKKAVAPQDPAHIKSLNMLSSQPAMR